MDIRQNALTVLIGTLFKDMSRKPSILKDITGILGHRRPMHFCTEQDTCILEDSSGRIRLKDTTPQRNMFSRIVTGSIIGCLGRADVNGVFFVEDYVLSEYISEPNLIADIQYDLRRSLFDRTAL